MKAFVLLHGQTDFDAEGRIIGSGDRSLNELGKTQAREAAKALQSKGIDMILSSPQTHTMETSEIIAEGLSLGTSKITKGLILKERAFGDFEGKPKSEVDMFVLCSWFGHAVTPNGETLKETVGRVIPYMNNMVKIFRTKTMLLVVPEHVARVLFWFFNGLPKPGKERTIEPDNCAIYEFDTDDIPQEIKDFSSVAALPVSSDGTDDPGRLLTQAEIDDLIEEILNK